MAAFSYHHLQSTHVQHEDLTNVSSPFPPYSYFYSPPTPTPSHSTTSQHLQSNQSSSMDNNMIRKNNTNTEGKRRKQKRSRSEVKDGEKSGASKCDGGVGRKKKKNQDQLPQTGYIHVRARRGQATDSHSLAERVRREKISERMKMLQGLVPGCDKVVGKALMLDEIINYVQSLQNQVEFLSTRLASANPSVYHFGVDLDGHMLQHQELESMTGAVQQTAHIEPTTLVEGTNNYPMVDTSAPFPHHGHGPSVFPQENEGFVMPMDEQSQRLLLDQFQFSNMCNFH